MLDTLVNSSKDFKTSAKEFFSLPRRSRLLHFFAHVITNILPAASYLQAFCFSISLKCPLAPSGYPPKPRKRGPLGGASQASLNCRFPAGASAKRRGRWPLARADPSRLVFIKVHLQGIRRNPASGVPSAELRFARANSPRCARPVQVFASSPPARKKGMTNVMPFRVLVEMIRLELTTYTLRTYRSTG